MATNKIFASLFAATAMLLASCSQDGDQLTSESAATSIPLEKISFSAELPEPDRARTTLADDGHKVIWTKGSDKISVFSDNEPTRNREFTAVDANESEAVFEGTASNTIKYSAIYPYSASNTFNKTSSTFSTTLKTEQSAVVGTYADNTSIAVATLEGYNAKTNKRFKFRNATGLLKIEFSLAASLAGKEITRIELRANPDAEGVRPSISGTASVTAGTSAQRPTAKIVAEGKPYIALSNGGAAIAPTTGGKGYYMVVPTEAIGQNFSLTFIASDGTGITKKFAITTPFVSNKIKSISVNLDQLETRMLTNIPLINAIKRQGINLIAEADGTVNYFKNIDEIERARTLSETGNTELISLRELEYYSNLRTVNLVKMPTLTGAVNIDKNPHLQTLTLDNIGISSVNVENANKFTTAKIVSNSSLESIKLASTSLTSLDARLNYNLNSIDVTEVPNLTYLEARNAKIESIDLTRNPALDYLNLHYSSLQAIDLSQNPVLRDLTLTNNQLTAIDLTHNPALVRFDLHGNQLRTIDLTANTELTYAKITNNNLEGVLDLSRNAKITELNVGYNYRLEDVTFPQDSKIKILKVNHSGITTLDVTNIRDVETIEVHESSQLSSIVGLSGLSKLKRLLAYACKLATLDVTQNTQLLSVAANPLHAGRQQNAIVIRVTMTAAQKTIFDTLTTNNQSVNVVVQ